LLGDPLKIDLAAELQKQTKLSMAWIAKELHAGAHFSCLGECGRV
jgi:hypothetical protein